LRQKKGYGAKKFIAEFPSKQWTLTRLNKQLPNTGRLHCEVTSQKLL